MVKNHIQFVKPTYSKEYKKNLQKVQKKRYYKEYLLIILLGANIFCAFFI
tara:strand:- start:169 stop:318 length:150 start_codon:yes stop_codon:yes gene_type:complete